MSEENLDLQLRKAVEDLDKETVQKLLATPELNPNKQDKNGRTALMALVSGSKSTTKEPNRVQIAIQLLACAKIDINLTDKFGNTAFLLAAKNKFSSICLEMIKRTAVDVTARNHKDECGWTPLIQAQTLTKAIKYKDSSLVDKVLGLGADINAKNNDDLNALMTAIIFYNQEAVDRLLKRHDLDINASNRYGDTALNLALRKRNLPLISELLSHPEINPNQRNKYNKAALQIAVELNNPDLLTCLALNQKVDPTLPTSNGKDLLLYAIEKRKHLSAQSLAAFKNININVKDPESGDTPLILAVKSNNNQLVEALIVNGADPNIKNKKGETALMAAIKNSNALSECGCIKVLLEAKNLSYETCGEGCAIIQKLIDARGFRPPESIWPKMKLIMVRLRQLASLQQGDKTQTPKVLKRPRISDPIYTSKKDGKTRE